MKGSQTSPSRRRLPPLCIGIYLLAAVSALLYFLFTRYPRFADWFNLHVSRFGRRLLAWQTNALPFSTAELLLLLIPLFLVLLIVLAARHYTATRRDALIYVGMLISGVLVIAILFVWNFAPGYYGTTLDRKLGLDREKVSGEELYLTAELLSEELHELSEEITFLPSGHSLMPYSYREMNDRLNEAYARYCVKNDYLDHFRSNVKPIMLSEPMSYTHITGVYTYFTGESNLNVNFPDYTLPFTAAHELAHQRGIAREDEANFIAFLVCMKSDDPYIRYSGLLNMYEYVAYPLSSYSELYTPIAKSLDIKVRYELKAYSEFFDKYRHSTAGKISESINNGYLQSVGTEGTKSYGMVVDLAVAYLKKDFSQ